MNDSSLKRACGEKNPDESRVKFQKVFEKMQENLNRVEKCVSLSKSVISECCDKLIELHSQVAELESILKETPENDELHSLDTIEEIKEKNQLQEISDQENVEGITVDGREKSDNFSNASGTNNCVNESKIQKINPEHHESCSIVTQANDTAGPSQETSIGGNNRYPSKDEEIMIEREPTGIVEAYIVEDAAETALLNTEGVLSAQELKSFLCLTDEVKDPVHLAKVSFTTDIERLYYQLITFHFLLKEVNNAAKIDRNIFLNSNRELEVKVQHLIEKFQPVIN